MAPALRNGDGYREAMPTTGWAGAWGRLPMFGAVP
jgi:hypothetical protein